jgi:hypothetical protein
VTAAIADIDEGHDFSLVLGGPLYQLLRRARLSDDHLGMVVRRIVITVLITWLPLLLLSALDGGLFGAGRKAPFIEDVGFHLRFLVVGPILIASELLVHQRLFPLVRQFESRNLIKPEDAERFADALAAAVRWRNSIWAEVLLLVVVYVGGGLFTLHRYEMLGGGAWFAKASGGDGLSPAGYWLVFVSLPLLQFLLLRWYFRLAVWAGFLWKVSRLDLDLMATHPDKSGGLGFLAGSLIAFMPLAAAHGALFAGMIADRILFAGAKLPQFQLDIMGGAAFLLAVFAGPLLVFMPRLAKVKRAGLLEFGGLAQVYVRDFRGKWFWGLAQEDEPLVGSGDIQSLADLGNSFEIAQQMRITPIRLRAAVNFVAAFLAPIVPLALTMMPAEKLVQRLLDLIV